MSYLSSFIRLTWLSVGASPIFVAVTECEIGVRTRRRTVLINANFWLRVQHPRPYCTTITSGSIPFRSIPGFIPSRACRRQVLIGGYLIQRPCYCCTGFCSIFATLAEMNKAKSVVLPYMEVKFCTQWEHGYVIVLIMCLCGHICCKDSAKLCMHLYLNCIQNKNSTQSLFRDISLHCCWCCKEALLPSKVLWRHGMCCSAASLQLSVQLQVSKWLVA